MTQMMNWWINIKWQRLHSDTQIQRVTDDSRNTLLWISSRDDGRNKGRLLTDKRYEQFKMNQQNTYFEQLESSGKHKSNSSPFNLFSIISKSLWILSLCCFNEYYVATNSISTNSSTDVSTNPLFLSAALFINVVMRSFSWLLMT